MTYVCCCNIIGAKLRVLGSCVDEDMSVLSSGIISPFSIGGGRINYKCHTGAPLIQRVNAADEAGHLVSITATDTLPNYCG